MRFLSSEHDGDLAKSITRLEAIRDALNDGQATLRGRDCDVDAAHHIDVVLNALKEAQSK